MKTSLTFAVVYGPGSMPLNASMVFVTMPVASFKQPTGIVTKTIDAFSGMLPGPYTTAKVSEVFIKGTEPTQVDNTKVPVDVDSDTNTLWTPDCPGTKVTKGFLDLSRVDASNPNFQKYDDIWTATAEKG